jgi:hypothetical protein
MQVDKSAQHVTISSDIDQQHVFQAMRSFEVTDLIYQTER